MIKAFFLVVLPGLSSMGGRYLLLASADQDVALPILVSSYSAAMLCGIWNFGFGRIRPSALVRGLPFLSWHASIALLLSSVGSFLLASSYFSVTVCAAFLMAYAFEERVAALIGRQTLGVSVVARYGLALSMIAIIPWIAGGLANSVYLRWLDPACILLFSGLLIRRGAQGRLHMAGKRIFRSLAVTSLSLFAFSVQAWSISLGESVARAYVLFQPLGSLASSLMQRIVLGGKSLNFGLFKRWVVNSPVWLGVIILIFAEFLNVDSYSVAGTLVILRILHALRVYSGEFNRVKMRQEVVFSVALGVWVILVSLVEFGKYLNMADHSLLGWVLALQLFSIYPVWRFISKW